MLIAFFRETTNDLSAKLQNPNYDWESRLREASNEGVLPALRQQIAALPDSNSIPYDIIDLLGWAEALNGERNEAILAAAAHAARLLNGIGIQPVALKGVAYLLTDTYPNPAARYLLDIDLLLPPGDVDRAAAHLLANGYYQNDTTFLNFRHHYPAICCEGSPNFELHYQVILGAYNRLLPSSKILAHARTLNFKGATFLIPSPTDLVNHLILHSQLAHRYSERVFPPLRALVDLNQLQTRFGAEIDWHTLVKTYRDNGQSATLILHVHQAHEILDFPIPGAIPTKLPFLLRLRYRRRTFLNRHPTLRFFDPTYILMSIFSRRLRLLPLILRTPSSWPQLLLLLTRPTFYRNLIG